jgi:hypothetical protein
MELVVNENTTIIDKKDLRNATTPDGTIFTERRMIIKILFTGALFMKIEQKVEYTGEFSKIKPYLFRI